MKRYIRNMNMLSKEENEKLAMYKVCVVGCGGLGGYIIEMLARLGIGCITAVDGDVFDETNLNRQLLCHSNSLGLSKALEAKKRVELVNPLVKVIPVIERLCTNNANDILKGHDVIVDALDNVESRLILQDTASNLEIPLVHGAIGGWFGQVTTILPGDNTLSNLYIDTNEEGVEKELGNPSFTPALVASIEVSEVLKILVNRGELLRKKLLVIDTYNQSYDVIDIDK